MEDYIGIFNMFILIPQTTGFLPCGCATFNRPLSRGYNFNLKVI